MITTFWIVFYSVLVIPVIGVLINLVKKFSRRKLT